MNEQFSKLLQECIVPADQAVEYSKSKGFVIPDEKLDVAKLAELIVLECAELVETQHTWITSVAASALIRKHFGVEE
jgi:hypothetical protein